MWEIIVKIWNWFGGNAGQIQIVIAIIAFVLAYVVYRKVLDQIKISIKQTNISIQQDKIANEQRIFELKLKITHSLLYSITNCKLIITKYRSVIAEYSFFLEDNKNNSKNMELLKKINTLFVQMKEQEIRVKALETRIDDVSKSLKEIKTYDIGILENFLMTSTELSEKLNKLSQSPDRYLISLKKFKRYF